MRKTINMQANSFRDLKDSDCTVDLRRKFIKVHMIAATSSACQ